MQKKSSDILWKWIKYRLDIQGLSFNKLAFLYKVDRTCFTGLKNNPFPKYERIISDHLGVDPWDLWPERYDANHNPSRVSSRYPGHKFFLVHDHKESNKKL